MPLIVKNEAPRHELLCTVGEAEAVARNIIEWARIDPSIVVTVRRGNSAEVPVQNPLEYHDGLAGFLIEWTEMPNDTITIYPTGNPTEDQRRKTTPISFSINAAKMFRFWNELPRTPWSKVLGTDGRGDVIRGLPL